MAKFLDWKGNEIKAGMTIYLVQTKPMSIGKFGMFMPDGSGGHTEVWESDEDYDKRKNEEIWELGNPYEVSERDGRLFITINYKDDPDIQSLTTPLGNPFGELPPIAIKGVSDKNEIKQSIKKQ